MKKKTKKILLPILLCICLALTPNYSYSMSKKTGLILGIAAVLIIAVFLIKGNKDAADRAVDEAAKSACQRGGGDASAGGCPPMELSPETKGKIGETACEQHAKETPFESVAKEDQLEASYV